MAEDTKPGPPEVTWKALAWVTVPTLAAALLTTVLMLWPARTKVEIEATARRAQFHILGDQTHILLESAQAISLHMRGFQRVSLTPSLLEFRNGRDSTKWVARLPVPGNIAWVPSGDPGDETLTLRSDSSDQISTLELERLFVSSADVTVAAPRPGVLSLQIVGLQQPGTIKLPRKFVMEARHVKPELEDWPAGQSLTSRISLNASNRLLEFSPGRAPIIFEIEFPKETTLPDRQAGLPIDRIQFLDLDATGRPVTSISGPGEIRFRNLPEHEPIPLAAGKTLQIENLDRFQLRDIAFAPRNTGLRLKMDGTPGILRSGDPGAQVDRRVSQFDLVWKNQKLVNLLAILTWVVTTAAAGWKFFRGKNPR